MPLRGEVSTPSIDDDDGGEQVEIDHPVVPHLGGAIPESTLSSDVQGVFQSMMRLALVPADLGPALHVAPWTLTMKKLGFAETVYSFS